jgi:eukaryotic-like serine/threonine-protein kinase
MESNRGSWRWTAFVFTAWIRDFGLGVLYMTDNQSDGCSPMDGAVLVLPPDTVILEGSNLPVAVRERIHLKTGDHVVSRPGAAVASVVIDQEGARLLGEFRQPCGIVNAVISYSRQSRRDPEVVLDEAFELIKHLLRSGFLSQASSPRSISLKPLLASGDEVGGFKLLSCVKVSDATEVYQATTSGGQFAALKIFRPGASQTVAVMLANEFRLLQQLDGTVTPRVLGWGELEGRPYLGTEWFSGEQVSLAARELRQRGTPEARSKLMELCHGCVEAYAILHRQGVIHGDVHVGNLLVDDRGHIQIVDFGLAGCGHEQQYSCTRGGVAAFLEPEYARAVLARAAPPAATMLGEQYSVAAVVYSLLTGEHYLQFSLERDELFRRICVDEPIPLARRGAIWWPEGEPALKRALAKEAAARYPSLRSFARALRQAVDARQTRLRSKSPANIPATPKETRKTGPGLMGADAMVRNLVDAMGLRGDLRKEGVIAAPACSLSHGAAGVAYGLYRLACRWEDAAVLALADVWASQAVAACRRPDAFYNPEDGVTAATVGTTSPFHTASGVHCVRALVSHAMGDLDTQRASARAFLAASEGDGPSLDVTLGRSGTLLACAILTEAIGEDPATCEPLRPFGDTVMRRVWEQLNCHVPLTDGPPIGHLGVAHGWSGMAYAAMRWCRATGQSLPEGVEERLRQVAELAEPVGRGCRWPWLIRSRNERGASLYMPGWCNGTAGYAHVWVLAHQTFGEERYLELAVQAGRNTFEEPSSPGGLCCGLAGRAYALLCLYKYTQEREWLIGATHLAERALPTVHNGGAAAKSSSPSALEHRRHSLYKGELGLALLLADLSSPDESCMPFFEPEGWPEKKDDVRGLG